MKNITTRPIIDILLLLTLLIFIEQNLDNVLVNFLIATVFFIGFYTAKVFDHKKKTQKDEDAKQ